MRRTRILSQWVFGLFFVYLFMNTRYLGADVISYPVNAFFRLDPLAGIGSIIAGRKAIWFFWPLLILLPAVALFGRFFCGWICPMGSMLDLFGRRSRNMSPAPEGRYYRLKELVLIFLLGTSLFSLNLTGILDPISLLIRSLAMGVVPPLERFISSVFDAAYHVGGPTRSVTEPLYGWLTDHVLSFHLPAFRYTALFLGLIGVIIALELLERRFWCRNLCPLGALLSWFSWIAPLGLKAGEGCNACGKCAPACRMGAIEGAEKVVIRARDCTLCYDCVDACPDGFITHPSGNTGVGDNLPLVSLSRRQFLVGAGIGAVFPLTVGSTSRSGNLPPYLIRPPGAVPEADFRALCMRCGECMRVCLTNGLQPTLFESGLEGMWTPRLVSRAGYCEYSCTLCGQVCPTGAIAPLDQVVKRKVRIGTAVINRNTCIPFIKPEECLVCEEHCPTPRKAIVFDNASVHGLNGPVVVKQPRIIEDLCIGCGICETKCPLDGESAIRVINRGEDRAAAT
ncbi:MAG TPA: 4Fe-4S binding protein [Proteobacteria bacterium]|nr:putative electron transport protein YccM [bacterium BMS3Abin14]HDL53657.1 4Fe-4S binding protein [Pseudomonadota bacterium]